MELDQAFRMSWRAIRGHKLRSTLTTLGVVIGVAAVITFVTLGASLQVAVIGDIGGVEATTMNVWVGPASAAGGQGGPGFGAQPVFTERDVSRLQRVQGVEAVVPYGAVPATAVSFRNDTSATAGFVATSPEYFAGAEFSEGRAFEQGTTEVVLNEAAAGQFEENVSAGDTVTLTLSGGERRNATVAGVLGDSRGLSAFEVFGTQPRVYVPTDPFYTTVVRSPSAGTDQRVYSLLLVRADDPEAVDETQQRVVDFLRTQSDADTLAPEDYVIRVQTNEQLLDQVRDILNQFTGFITGIAVISLLVGAIGIANIMLVSVTERTREIGIMKAVGAQNRDVLTLFVVEAVVVGVIGALLGTLLGIGGGWLATTLLDLPLEFPLEWVPIAVTVGVLVGLVAGIYPAWQAARTDPIEALRYE